MPKKGEKFVRRSPRQRDSPVIKPFNAPRKVTLWEEDYSNSDVQAITETGNARDQKARQDKDVFVNPYPCVVLVLCCLELRCCFEGGKRGKTKGGKPPTTNDYDYKTRLGQSDSHPYPYPPYPYPFNYN
jgi:hypothetical protein